MFDEAHCTEIIIDAQTVGGCVPLASSAAASSSFPLSGRPVRSIQKDLLGVEPGQKPIENLEKTTEKVPTTRNLRNQRLPKFHRQTGCVGNQKSAEIPFDLSV